MDQIRKNIEHRAILLTFLGFICNLGTLFMFYKHNNLRTPFTIYLVFLVVSNLILTVTRRLLKILKIVFDEWSFGEFMCTVYNYTN